MSRDLPPEEFRVLAHELADWMADYLAGVGALPVSPAVRPGDVRRALPAQPPEVAESLEDVLKTEFHVAEEGGTAGAHLLEGLDRLVELLRLVVIFGHA